MAATNLSVPRTWSFSPLSVDSCKGRLQLSRGAPSKQTRLGHQKERHTVADASQAEGAQGVRGPVLLWPKVSVTDSEVSVLWD